MSSHRRLTLVALIGLAFVAPCALWQGQVILAMGFPYWCQDVLYSVAIKVPGATRLLGALDMAEVGYVIFDLRATREGG